MISISEAQVIAEKYVKDQRAIAPGIRYGLGDIKEFAACYYFDFKLIFSQPKDPNLRWGGAPGLVVDKQTGEVNVIAFWQLAKLSTD